ncbi:MAG: tetratricopeptide repeat protein [Buchnera aphidicola (Meitanaphis elongallis)]
MNINFTFQDKKINNIFFSFLGFTFFLFLFYFYSSNINNFTYIEDYEKIIQKNNSKNVKSVNEIVQFIENNKNNIYSSLASLQLAKIYIDSGNLNDALLILKKNLKHTPDVNIFNLITLNIAKIQFQLNDNLQAIKTIDHIKDNAWNSVKYKFKDNVFASLK